MTFTLTINCDNAAFDDFNSEVARILCEAAAKVRCEGDNVHSRPIFDRNGNHVGQYKWED